MADSQTGNKEVQGDLSDIKRKLAWRMGFAGLMIVGLLGGLALFDRLSAPPSETELNAPQFNEPVPVAKKVITQPVTPAEPTSETPKDESKTAAPESSAAPGAPVAPPRPEVAAQPAAPRALPPSSPPTSAARAVTAPSAASTPGMPAKSTESKPAPVPAAPNSAETPAALASTQPQPTPPRLFSGFALQAGVFSDPRRAEELHAKLTLEGIPSTIESRVEVGPFKTRAEAVVAREKIKALGIDTVLLMPKGVKR